MNGKPSRARDSIPAAMLVFALALVVRLILFGLSTHDLQATADSAIYIGIGHGVAETGDFVRKYNDHYEPVTERVPVYPAYLAVFFKLFGGDLRWPVIFQCVLDALTCVFVAFIGRELHPRLFLLSGILAAFNLNMAIHATLILTDTIFLLLFAGSILLLLKHAREPRLKWVGLASLTISLAVLTRPLLYYFLPVFFVILGTMTLLRRRSLPAVLRDCAAGLLVTALVIGPLLWRNHQQYGYFQLVSQGGAGAMEWYVPLTVQYATGESTNDVIRREQARLRQLLQDEPDRVLRDNPFYISERQVGVAREELSKLNLFQVAYAWTGGALLNIFTPSISSLPALVQMKRPRFFETEGSDVVHKAFNFLTHPDNRTYLLLVVPAILLTLLSRVVAFIGFFYVRKHNVSKIALAVLLIAAFYILAITGPLVSAARYRLPVEPILIVFLALGLMGIYDAWLARRRASSGARTSDTA